MGIVKEKIDSAGVSLAGAETPLPGLTLPSEQLSDLKRRLARVEGQVRGISKMLDDARPCKDIVTQFAAVSKALEQIGFRLVASQLSYCIENPEEALRDGHSLEQVEKLFLKLR